jgi:hypothetical protein
MSEDHAGSGYKQQSEASRFMAEMLGNTELIQALDDGRHFRWRPRTDITTYELAVCQFLIPMVINGEHWEMQHKVYDKLPIQAQRHFHVFKPLDGETTGEGGPR